MSLVFWTGSLVLAQPAAGQTSPRSAEAAPEIAVYTMGVGDDVFAHFGHTAICVRDKASLGGRCYNWGTADFSTPVPLTYEFVRGRAKFWVSVIDLDRMVHYYELEDRSIWRQILPLSSTQAIDLARVLDASTSEAVRYYRYHHFQDNCTTRIRDLVDKAFHGALHRLSDGSGYGETYREYARIGFRGYPWLLIAANLVLGRAADRPVSLWEAMFLPEVFRDAMERALGVKAELLYQRHGPPADGAIWAGDALLMGLGLGLGLLIFAAGRTSGGPRGKRFLSASLGLGALVLGLAGLFLWSLALASAFRELIYNEVLVILVPTDLLLPFLKERILSRYLRGRLLVIVTAGLLRGAGLFVQPLLPATLLAAPPLAAALWNLLRRR